MNGPRFNFYFLYIFDLNNLRTQGKVRTLSNPLSKKRLEAILEEKLINTDLKISPSEPSSPELDEVSILYYKEDTCNCSRKAKCITNKCSCYLKKFKCQPFCHPEAISNCSNK